MPANRADGRVTIVAILKGEEPFLDEWIAYHRLVGVDRFLLYDNDDRLPLGRLLARHGPRVAVVDWPGEHAELPGLNKQTKAYTDALARVDTEWVAFLDGDEFLVVREHADVPAFLADCGDAGAVQLTWHLFGGGGRLENPREGVTAGLTRRRALPGRMTKGVNRVAAVAAIRSAHRCALKPGFAAVDANRRPFTAEPYPGKSDVAHVNHYMCRSYRDWMKRIERGEAAFTRDSFPRTKDHLWRFDPEACHRKYLAVEREMNEIVDDYMLRYSDAIAAYLAGLPAPDGGREG